jgi:uncharacterized protein YodC (DUF2158 family)
LFFGTDDFGPVARLSDLWGGPITVDGDNMKNTNNVVTVPLKIGDTVVLKSHGPLMTVDSFTSDDRIVARCIWFLFDSNGAPYGDLQVGFFSGDSLKKSP